jgi:hypothetical protein
MARLYSTWPLSSLLLLVWLAVLLTLCQRAVAIANSWNVSTRQLRHYKSVASVPPQRRRFLQSPSEYLYSATYNAQFQVVQDGLCAFTPPPIVRVSCHGPDISVLQTSHSSIACDSVAVEDDNGWTVSCTNACATDDACRAVYLVTGDANDSINGPFANITFVCQSNETVFDVEAAVTVVASANAACAGSGSVSHYARLGVQCPPRRGNQGQIGDGDVDGFVFDNYYTECWLSFAVIGYANGIHTCRVRESCDNAGLACSALALDPVLVS